MILQSNICFVAPSLNVGGIERALVLLANEFITRGLNISFVSCLAGKPFYHLDERVALIEPTFRRKSSPLNKLMYYPLLLGFIRRKIITLNPDAVIVFGDWFSPLVLMALLGTKYPVYISDRTSPDYNFRFPIPLLKKWLYPKSMGYIAQTQRAARFKQMQFGDKLNIRVIPNAVRDVHVQPEIQRQKIILYVGRFAWEKGPDRLIKAFALLKGRLGWRLHMAGSGPLLQAMKELAISLEVENEVVFLGAVKDVDLLYAQAGIFVLPSLLEGFPNSLCEAMASGLPVICFDSIPTEALLTNGHDGIIVPDGNISKLSETIESLISNEEERLRLGNNANKIKERLSVHKIGDQILEFIADKY